MPTRIPRVIPGIDVRKLPLTPTDGYLLTRVNGNATVRDIARETGLFEPEVIESFEKLVKLGVVTFGRISEAIRAQQAAANVPAPLKAVALVAKYDLAALDEECDLTLDQRKRVLELFYALEDNDYYTLLGIARDSDKKSIKKAYYEVALPMHPDKFFRKSLGSFKPKMESVFAKLTLAQDVLLDKEKRVEYDTYLKDVASTKGMEAMLARAMEEGRIAAETAAAEAAHLANPTAPPPALSSAPPPAQSTPPAPPGVDPAVLAARRQALAARLMGGRRPVAAVAAPVEIKLTPVVQQSTDDAMDALRRRFTDRLSSEKKSQVARYVAAAEHAVGKMDWIAASNAYRIALDLAPDDPELVQRAQAAQAEANRLLSESYTKQASYEEREGRWPEAGRSWARVAKLKPQDARAAERAAFCICKAEGNMHEAADLARAAIKLEPTRIGHRMTLATVLIAAGKPLLAKREVEAAAQIAPEDHAVIAMMKKLP